MLKPRHLLVTILVLASTTAALRAAQTGIADEASLDTLLSAIRANRKAFIAINLQLTDEEAAKFWPVYDRYHQEADAVGDRLVALVQDYTASFGTLSNDKAIAIVKTYLEIENERVRVRSAYLDEFSKTLPGRKVARFYQMENKMDAILRYDLASTIPVIDEKVAAQPQ